jgi:hypothetical protein
MIYFTEFIKSPLNILIIILLFFSLFIVLGRYKEGFTSTEITGQTYKNRHKYMNDTDLTNINFTGPNGNNAEIISVNGNYKIIVTNSSGNKTTYNTSTNSNSSSLYSMKFYGQNGGTAQIITGPNGNNLIQITNKNGQITIFNSNNSSSPYSNYSSYSDDSSLPYNKNDSTNSYDYSSSLPPGIPMSQIAPGQEDLYILKSEIVPPVCPAPVQSIQNSTEQCAPCPPCGRCPQPSFECKKVPNYSSSTSNLPIASMSPYATYGS